MSENIPFFSDLPEAAVPLAAALWDNVMSPGYNGVAAYSEFVFDLERLRIEPPARAIVKRWQAGVQAGLIERPGGSATAKTETASVSAPRLKTADERRQMPVESLVKQRGADPAAASITDMDAPAAAAQLAAAAHDHMPSFDLPITEALRLVVERMLDDTAEQLQRQTRARASLLVAGRLREVAEELERRSA